MRVEREFATGEVIGTSSLTLVEVAAPPHTGQDNGSVGPCPSRGVSALHAVLLAMARREGRVPFRESQLTQLLQPALMESGLVYLIVPLRVEGLRSGDDAMRTLGFATHIKTLELERKHRTTAAASPRTAGEPWNGRARRRSGASDQSSLRGSTGPSAPGQAHPPVLSVAGGKVFQPTAGARRMPHA